MPELPEIVPILAQLHAQIRDEVVAALASRSTEDLCRVVADEIGDVVFALDRVAEKVLVEVLTSKWANQEPIVLVAEGLPSGSMVLPIGANAADCRWRVIVDPIDGTRCLLYQKRSGWVLTGVAPNQGPNTRLSDIQLAIQTEIPLLKQHLSDQVWAIRGQGAHALRYNRLSSTSEPLQLRPSQADTIQYGYAAISRFFPGTRDVLASIEDEVIFRALGSQPPGGTLTFEDQYPCTGGQVYGLMSGADRFLADLRPLMIDVAAKRGETFGHCCHPYDICTALIAEELGVPITNADGLPLDAPLDVETNVDWVGYANNAIQRQIQPILLEVLHSRGLRT